MAKDAGSITEAEMYEDALSVTDFYAFPSTLLSRKGLKLGPKTTFAVLTQMLGVGVCLDLDPRWPSIDSLAKATGSTPKTVKRHIGKLEQAGMIRGFGQ